MPSAWQAASKQTLDRAYKLRDLVEQNWITPETFGSIRGLRLRVNG
jgi:two-component system chemotaxis response regulator CheB